MVSKEDQKSWDALIEEFNRLTGILSQLKRYIDWNPERTRLTTVADTAQIAKCLRTVTKQMQAFILERTV